MELSGCDSGHDIGFGWMEVDEGGWRWMELAGCDSGHGIGFGFPSFNVDLGGCDELSVFGWVTPLSPIQGLNSPFGL